MPSRLRLLRPLPYFVCLSIVAIALAATTIGCSRGAHAGTTVKTDKNETPTIKAAVMTVASLNWPAVVRTQGSIIAD